MAELAMIIKTEAQPGKRDELFDLYRRILAPQAEQNPEQTLVVWSADDNDPNTFYLFEIYANREAMGVNAGSSWFAEYMAQAGPLLAGEPSVGMATPMWSKGTPAA